MPKGKVVFAAALSALLLTACGSRGSAAAENEAVQAGNVALENASPSDPGQVNGSDAPDANSAPPPDAVSHPNGFLPYGEDSRPPSEPEPGTDAPSGSPPATEDQYLRNRQAGS